MRQNFKAYFNKSSKALILLSLKQITVLGLVSVTDRDTYRRVIFGCCFGPSHRQREPIGTFSAPLSGPHQFNLFPFLRLLFFAF